LYHPLPIVVPPVTNCCIILNL